MTIRPGCAQHIGSRKEQQDSFAFSHIEDAALVERAGVLAVVADGMGGLALGRESADTAVKAVISVHESSRAENDPVAILQEAVETANRDVVSMARNAGVAGDAGSTLAAVIVKNENLYWTSVGDSRIYLCRSGELVQLNSEQNHASDLMRRVAAGDISRDDALNNPNGAALTNFIGNPDLMPADASVRPFPLTKGDWLLLCSDGLFGTLDDDDIRGELYGNPDDACDRLVKKTIACGKPHQDNVSAAILGYGDAEPLAVKSRMEQAAEVFQPLPPAGKTRKPLVWGLVAVLLLAVVGGAVFCGWKKCPTGRIQSGATPVAPPVIKMLPCCEGVQKSISSTTKPHGK